MDELAKTEARNYLSSAGYIIIAILLALYAVAFMSGKDVSPFVTLAIAISLATLATLLIIFKNRDLTAISFFMFGALSFVPTIVGFSQFELSIPIFAIAFFVVALIYLTTGDSKKWILFLLSALNGVRLLVRSFVPADNITNLVLLWIILALALYCGVALALEKVKLPLSNVLTADENVDVKSVGSIVGYVLFALPLASHIFVYIVGETTSYVQLLTFDSIIGAMLFFVSIILLTVGKMRFTPVMFMLMGIVTFLSPYISQSFFFINAGLLIVLGLIAFMRTEKRILLGLMLTIYGINFIFVAIFGWFAVPLAVSILMNGIPGLIALYLAFAIANSKKALPLC